ncbi:MAG: hypothetical protein H6713_25240 [Myxococcales bacterium]|nr:hypothetical protein [Myxococcales bacterium]
MPSLRRNFAWSFVGQSVLAASQWSMVALLTKLGPAELADNNLGVFALGLAIVAPLNLLGMMQLRPVLASDASRRHALADYVALRVLTMVFAVAASLLFMLRYPPGELAALLLIASCRAVEGVSDLLYGLWQRAEDMRRVTVSQTLHALTSPAALAAGLILSDGSLWIACAAWLATRVAVLLIHDVPCARRTARADARAHPEAARGLTRAGVTALSIRAAPLGAVAGLVSFNTNIPRYFIEAWHDAAALGVFVAVGYFTVGTLPIVGALNAATMPRVSTMWLNGQLPALRRLVARIVGLAALPAVVAFPLAIAIGGPVLALLYRPEYARHVELLLVFVGVALLNSVAGVLRMCATAFQRFTIQVPMTIGAVVVTAIAGALWIPSSPLLGAAAAVVAGRGFIVVTNAAVVAHALWRAPPPRERGATS